jgi:hypothetical protein
MFSDITMLVVFHVKLVETKNNTGMIIIVDKQLIWVSQLGLD